MRATKKKAKKNIAGKMFFLSPEMNSFFSDCFFYLPKFPFFLAISNNSMRALGRKKHMFFFGNARPKSNARAHLNQRQKT